jgi:hypothetical protein
MTEGLKNTPYYGDNLDILRRHMKPGNSGHWRSYLHEGTRFPHEDGSGYSRILRSPQPRRGNILIFNVS